MKIFLIAATLISNFLIASSSPDSLFNRITERRFESGGERVIEPVKSGFGELMSVKTEYDNFTSIQKEMLKKLFLRPDSDTSIVSPSGYFRIHFFKDGEKKPQYDVNELAASFDSVYNFEINILGYPIPPSDGLEGGDEKYDIYIDELSYYYGETIPENEISENIYTSFIRIDNSFKKFPSKGISGARVTAAHEFFHSIQIGYYGYYSKELFFYEMSSVAMEEFMYPEINDYFHYLKTYFNSPDQNITNYDYSLGIFVIYLKEKFGYGILKEIWENIRTWKNTVSALDITLKKYGTNFKSAFNEFGIWSYYTNYRAKENNYFPDAEDFPSLNLTDMGFVVPEDNYNISSFPAANNFLFIINAVRNDSLLVIITNSDLSNAYSEGSLSNITYSLSEQPKSEYTEVTSGYYQKLTANDLNKIASRFIINGVLSEVVQTAFYDMVFPQPFIHNIHSAVNIPVAKGDAGNISLFIYSASMNKIFEKQYRLTSTDDNILVWNCKDKYGKPASSGVYIYIISSSSGIRKGKLMIINE